MKKVRMFLFTFAFALSALIAANFTPSTVQAADNAALIAKGKELFHSKKGLNVKFECIMCHKQPGKEVKKSHVLKAGDKLPSVINKYITQKSKGKAIAADSEEMKALIAYIQEVHAK